MQPRIILLEDEDLIRFSLTTKLSKSGFDVMSFADPTLCPIYSGAEQFCPLPDDYRCGDFLLTDNKMPNMTGLEFVELLLEKGCKGDANNMAIMSAYWSDEDLKKAQDLGCQIFHKPYEFEDLLDWLEGRRESIDLDRQLVSFTC